MIADKPYQITAFFSLDVSSLLMFLDLAIFLIFPSNVSFNLLILLKILLEGQMFYSKLLVTLSLCTVGILAHAKTDAELMASGQWRDAATGLIWMRCFAGQSWTGRGCVGEATQVRRFDAPKYVGMFNQAGGFASQTNWRLPTIVELASLRRCNKLYSSVTLKNELTADGYKQVKKETVQYIKVPAGKATTLIPFSCQDGQLSDNRNDPRNWKIDTKIFPAVFSSHEASLGYVASPSPSHVTQPLWSVNFWINGTVSNVSSGYEYQVPVMLVRKDK